MAKVKFEEEGRCPVCGAIDVDYDVLEYEGDWLWFPCTCEKCGAQWHECYDLRFSGVDYVCSKDELEVK